MCVGGFFYPIFVIIFSLCVVVPLVIVAVSARAGYRFYTSDV